MLHSLLPVLVKRPGERRCREYLSMVVVLESVVSLVVVINLLVIVCVFLIIVSIRSCSFTLCQVWLDPCKSVREPLLKWTSDALSKLSRDSTFPDPEMSSRIILLK